MTKETAMKLKSKTKRFSWFHGNSACNHRDTITTNPSEKQMTSLECVESFSPPREIAEALIQKARDIQMLPDVAIQAIAITESPGATVKEVVGLVAQDVQLTTDILSLSNSTLFAGTNAVASLEQAVRRNGFRQIKNMIMAASITSMMQNIQWKELRIRDLLCEHGLITAVINSRLNKLFKLGMQGEEFTAGLVHDIGRTLLAVAMPDQFSEFDPLDFDETEDSLLLEHNIIGTNHSIVGAWFLQRNHLPEELVTVARYHHSVADCTKFKRLVALTAVADELANHYQRDGLDSPSLTPEGYEGSENLQILEQLGVEGATERLREFTSELVASSVDEVRSLMRV